MVTFYLNNDRVTLSDTPADMTVLDLLRERLGKRGTKEGCASGDCGACTVVLASLSEQYPGTLEYMSANACILFVGALQGKQLLTVEDLSDGENLHPVQQVMVDFHGSQCGFCTPGFIMSLFNLYQNVSQGRIVKPANGWHSLIEAHLGGNLCRCTGYRPIVDAAQTMLDRITVAPQSATRSATQPATVTDPSDSALNSLSSASDIVHRLQELTSDSHGSAAIQQRFHNPQSLKNLSDLIRTYPDARLVAGGTDLALEVTQQLQSLPLLINVQQVRELNQIIETADHWQIGAAVSIYRLAEAVHGHWPDLDRLLLRFGATQVRSQGTLGGNLCTASPIGDLPPVLLALNADVHIHNDSSQRTVSIDDFFTGYRQTALTDGEYLHSVSIPKDADLQVYKISKRYEDDISTVCGAYSLGVESDRITSARVAFGGMAATPKRAINLEQALTGLSVADQSVTGNSEQYLTALKHDYTPLSDARASAHYRMQMAAVLTGRALQSRTNATELMEIHDYVH